MMRIFNSGFFKAEVWILICWLPFTLALGQGNPKAALRMADLNFEEGNYREAIIYYNKYLGSNSRNDKAIERLAFSQLQMRDLAGAIRRYQSLLTIRASKNPVILYHLAEAYHLNEDYSKAMDYYKQFLSSSKQKDDLRLIAIDQIKRCGVGLRNSINKQGILVENLGPDVNTVFDDFGPVESPNISNRIYFSSNRSIKKIDQIGKRSKLIGRKEVQHSDLFVTEIIEGIWGRAEPMNISLNTEHDEILGDFVSDGSIAFFWRGSESLAANWYVDTFMTGSSSGSLLRGVPFYHRAIQKGIFFYSDSLLFFSSNRPGGFGGFDLYYSSFKEGRWTPPQNMGPGINSPFDEITPFLANDGETIYFSSNGLTSMGDFDIFKAKFDRRKDRWEPPENLGKPINSAGRDLGCHFSWDGKYAYFGSDRNSGYGGLDLYSVYFYDPLSEQTTTSFPWFEEQTTQGNREELLLFDKREKFKIPVFKFNDQAKVITTKNSAALDSLVEFLNAYPKLGISIFCFTYPQKDKNLELFLSIQAAKQVADYMRQRGVSTFRLYIRSFGSHYSQAKPDQNPGPIDQRIEFSIFHLDSTSLLFQEELFIQRNNSHEPTFAFWEKMRGITFSVQFIETTQMYKGQILNGFSGSTIELVDWSDIMRYCSGVFNNFAQAQDHFARIREFGVSKPLIVPYLDGKRLNTEEISENTLNKYPTLRDFLVIQN